MHITLVIKAGKKKKNNDNYKPIYHKNLKYRYVTIKIHSTISKLKKARLKIALKSRQVWNITKLMHCRAFHNLGTATWLDLSPSMNRALAVLIKICFAFTSVLHIVTL